MRAQGANVPARTGRSRPAALLRARARRPRDCEGRGARRLNASRYGARPQGRTDGRRFLLAEMPANQSLMKTEIYGMDFDLTGLDERFLTRAKRPLAGDW